MKLTFIAIANGGKGWESALGMTQEMTGEKLEYFLEPDVRHERDLAACRSWPTRSSNSRPRARRT